MPLSPGLMGATPSRPHNNAINFLPKFRHPEKSSFYERSSLVDLARNHF